MAPPKKSRNSPSRRACPPPLVRSPQTGKCVLPPRVLGGSPFGGPATSPFGFGNPGSPAQPSPAPIPTPTCVEASIFSDCFGVCAGTINGGAPGPVCGWAFIEPFGPLGGEFNFTPGIMSMDTAGTTENPNSAKPLPLALASVFGISGQFDFTEYATPPNPTTTYNIFVNNSGITESLAISLFGDGNLAVQAGDSTLIPLYLGAWTPTAGASHTVHFTIDGGGVPRVWLDGVEIPLAFLADVATFFSLYPDNSISFNGGAGDAAPAQAPLRRLFITAGIFGPETIFCCP